MVEVERTIQEWAQEKTPELQGSVVWHVARSVSRTRSFDIECRALQCRASTSAVENNMGNYSISYGKTTSCMCKVQVIDAMQGVLGDKRAI